MDNGFILRKHVSTLARITPPVSQAYDFLLSNILNILSAFSSPKTFTNFWKITYLISTLLRFFISVFITLPYHHHTHHSKASSGSC